MAQKNGREKPRKRRVYSEEFKEEAVQMLVDGHTAGSVAARLGLSAPSLLYRWKKELLGREEDRRPPRGKDACGNSKTNFTATTGNHETSTPNEVVH